MKKALLVMDMQEVTVGGNHADFFRYDSDLLQKVNAVIRETDAEAVVYLRNLMKRNLLSRFAPVKVFDGTPEAALAKELLVVSPHIFSKYRGDAFSAPDFCAFLKSSGTDTVELTGVDGGGCVSLTALGAVRNGYRVIVNTSAVGTMFQAKKERLFEKLKKAGAVFI